MHARQNRLSKCLVSEILMHALHLQETSIGHAQTAVFFDSRIKLRVQKYRSFGWPLNSVIRTWNHSQTAHVHKVFGEQINITYSHIRLRCQCCVLICCVFCNNRLLPLLLIRISCRNKGRPWHPRAVLLSPSWTGRYGVWTFAIIWDMHHPGSASMSGLCSIC